MHLLYGIVFRGNISFSETGNSTFPIGSKIILACVREAFRYCTVGQGTRIAIGPPKTEEGVSLKLDIRVYVVRKVKFDSYLSLLDFFLPLAASAARPFVASL